MMMSDDEDLYALVREDRRNKLIVGALAATFAVETLANSFAGRGTVDGWLAWSVVSSALLMLTTFGIISIVRMVSGRSLSVADLPSRFVRVAAGLAGAYAVISVLIVVTP